MKEEIWIVQRCPRGGTNIATLRQVTAENCALVMSGQWSGYVSVGYAANEQEAHAVARDLEAQFASAAR